MDESDKISSEQKQENTVITISQSPPLSHDQTQSVCIIQPQLPVYGNTFQNTDYIHNTHTSCSLQGENHNQLDVHLLMVTLNNPYNSRGRNPRSTQCQQQRTLFFTTKY